MSTRRFAFVLVVLAILTVATPQATNAAGRPDAMPFGHAQLPNDPPFFDRLPPSGNTISVLDSTGSVGMYSSATIGADGLGLISYTDATNKDLKVAHCSDVECSAATLATLDATGDVGKHTSITIGADGLGLISYFNATTQDLKVAHCSDVVCSTATITTIDSAGRAGEYTSLVLGRDGLGLISYYSDTAGIKVAHCTNVACTSATTQRPEVERQQNEYVPLVYGTFSSITIGSDGFGIIAYYDTFGTAMRLLHCTNVACSRGTKIIGDTPGNVGLYPSATVDANGLALFSYYDATQSRLKIGTCSSIQCLTFRPEGGVEDAYSSVAIDSANDVGTYSALTIGVDGNPLVAYYDATNADLKVTHCSNPFCTPFFRRR